MSKYLGQFVQFTKESFLKNDIIGILDWIFFVGGEVWVGDVLSTAECLAESSALDITWNDKKESLQSFCTIMVGRGKVTPI